MALLISIPFCWLEVDTLILSMIERKMRKGCKNRLRTQLYEWIDEERKEILLTMVYFSALVNDRLAHWLPNDEPISSQNDKTLFPIGFLLVLILSQVRKLFQMQWYTNENLTLFAVHIVISWCWRWLRSCRSSIATKSTLLKDEFVNNDFAV